MTRRSPRFLNGVVGGWWSHSVGQEIEKGEEQAKIDVMSSVFFKLSLKYKTHLFKYNMHTEEYR